MNKLVLTAVLSTLAAAACSHVREPDDAQLANLLLGERANPLDANARLDVRVIECMRAWSGNADLLKGLAVRYAGEDGKKSCRTTLDGRLADSDRNPDKFRFADISAPKVVRRALEMQSVRRLATASTPPGNIPPALLQPRAPLAFGKADPNVDLGLAGVRLKEAETLCQQAQQVSAAPDAESGLVRYARFCAGSLGKMRGTMEAAARHGRAPEQLQALADSADNMANTARDLLAAPKQ